MQDDGGLASALLLFFSSCAAGGLDTRTLQARGEAFDSPHDGFLGLMLHGGVIQGLGCARTSGATAMNVNGAL